MKQVEQGRLSKQQLGAKPVNPLLSTRTLLLVFETAPLVQS